MYKIRKKLQIYLQLCTPQKAEFVSWIWTNGLFRYSAHSPTSSALVSASCYFWYFVFLGLSHSVAIFLQVRYYWRYFDNKSSTLFKHCIFLSSFSYFLKADASLQGIELANRDLQSISLSFSVAQRKLSFNWTQSSDDNCRHNSIKMLCILMNPIFSLIVLPNRHSKQWSSNELFVWLWQIQVFTAVSDIATSCIWCPTTCRPKCSVM